MRISSRLRNFSEGGDDECFLWQVQILTCALYADIFFVGVLVDVVRDDNIPAAGMFFNEFRQAVMSHVYHDIAFRLDDVVGSADDFIGVVGGRILCRVYTKWAPRERKKAMRSFRRRMTSWSSHIQPTTSSGHWKWMMS